MTGVYFRAKRDGHFQNIEIEHLTNKERMEMLSKWNPEEMLRAINLLCEVIETIESAMTRETE